MAVRRARGYKGYPGPCREICTEGIWPLLTPCPSPNFQTPTKQHSGYLKASLDGLLHQRPCGQPSTVVVVEPVHELAPNQLHRSLEPRLGMQRRVSGGPKRGGPMLSPLHVLCPHLGVLLGVVPAGVQVAHTGTEGGGEGVAGLPLRLRDAVVDGIDLLHKVLIQLGTEWGTWWVQPGWEHTSSWNKLVPSFMGSLSPKRSFMG